MREVGGSGAGGAVFLFKCPLCGAEASGSSLEGLTEEAGDHMRKEHGVEVAGEELYRYITRGE
ncbi:MAG: DUF1059 domain-containing protein [Fervidicoccaceae archaeon]